MFGQQEFSVTNRIFFNTMVMVLSVNTFYVPSPEILC